VAKDMAHRRAKKKRNKGWNFEVTLPNKAADGKTPSSSFFAGIP
jgi:hypothetical protein